MRQLSERRQQTARPGGRLHPGHPAQAEGRVGNKNPTQKNPKKPPKNPTKSIFLGFIKFLILYENNTNFSLRNRFFMNK